MSGLVTVALNVAGSGEYGPTRITIGTTEIVCRINPPSERRPYRCTACGTQRTVNGCTHVQLAVLARQLTEGTQP